MLRDLDLLKPGMMRAIRGRKRGRQAHITETLVSIILQQSVTAPSSGGRVRRLVRDMKGEVRMNARRQNLHVVSEPWAPVLKVVMRTIVHIVTLRSVREGWTLRTT